MGILKYVIAGAAALAASSAVASVVVIGSSTARMCYEAAEARSALSLEGMRSCNDAIDGGSLTTRDLVASYVNRGILKLRAGLVDEAIADFDDAIELDPQEPEAYLNKAVATLQRNEDWRQALPLFNTALEKRTRKPAIAHFGRAVAHEMSGNVREAYRDYRQASLLEPGWKNPRNELARFKVR